MNPKRMVGIILEDSFVEGTLKRKYLFNLFVVHFVFVPSFFLCVLIV